MIIYYKEQNIKIYLLLALILLIVILTILNSMVYSQNPNQS
jgi:hypothetical protein